MFRLLYLFFLKQLSNQLYNLKIKKQMETTDDKRGTGPVQVHVQYCGGWGYGPKVTAMIERLETEGCDPLGKFTFHIHKDAGKTGNYEVHTGFVDEGNKGTLVFSKQEKKVFPFADDDTWNAYKEALMKWNWDHFLY